jgi:hypothetical protein
MTTRGCLRPLKQTSEVTFQSNDELEEEQDLLMHFPDHLGVFQDIALKGD